jgi:hypothetical protein
LTRQIALLLAAAAVMLPLMLATPGAATEVVFVSATGSDSNTCTALQPCATFSKAVTTLVNNAGNGGQINCLSAPGPADVLNLAGIGSFALTIDCPGGVLMAISPNNVLNMGSNQTLKFRHMTFNAAFDAGTPVIAAVGVSGSTLIFEDCVIENESGNYALSISPSGGPFNLALSHTRISNSGAAVVMLPATGGSVTATLDHVTITQNGGGIHTDSRNGTVTVDIIDSIISDNTSNGINVVSHTGGHNNVVTVSRSTIARNGLVGIQVSGSNAAALVDTTLLENNTNGATFIDGGGRLLSYGNNRIVGSSGSGFTGSALLQ